MELAKDEDKNNEVEEETSESLPFKEERAALQDAVLTLYETLTKYDNAEQPGVLLFLDTGARPLAKGFKPVIDVAYDQSDNPSPLLRLAGISRGREVARAYYRASDELEKDDDKDTAEDFDYSEPSEEQGVRPEQFVERFSHWLRQNQIWKLEEEFDSMAVLACADSATVEGAYKLLEQESQRPGRRFEEYRAQDPALRKMLVELASTKPLKSNILDDYELDEDFSSSEVLECLVEIAKSGHKPESIRKLGLLQAQAITNRIEDLENGAVSPEEIRLATDLKELGKRLTKLVKEADSSKNSGKILVIDDVLHSGSSFHLLLRAASDAGIDADRFDFFVAGCIHNKHYFYGPKGEKIPVTVGAAEDDHEELDLFSGFSWRYMGNKEPLTGVRKQVSNEQRTTIKPEPGRLPYGRDLRERIASFSESVAELCKDT